MAKKAKGDAPRPGDMVRWSWGKPRPQWKLGIVTGDARDWWIVKGCVGINASAIVDIKDVEIIKRSVIVGKPLRALRTSTS